MTTDLATLVIDYLYNSEDSYGMSLAGHLDNYVLEMGLTDGDETDVQFQRNLYLDMIERKLRESLAN